MLAAFRSSPKPSKSFARRRDPIWRRIAGWIKYARSFHRVLIFEGSLAGEVGHPQSNQNFIWDHKKVGILDGQPAERLTLARDWMPGFAVISMHGLTRDYAHKVCQ